MRALDQNVEIRKRTVEIYRVCSETLAHSAGPAEFFFRRLSRLTLSWHFYYTFFEREEVAAAFCSSETSVDK